MTERAKSYFQQWLSPGVILGVIGWIFLLGVGSNRLASLEITIGELKTAIAASTAANQSATVELVRTQERLASANSRLAVLEEKMANQEQINVRIFSGLAKLGG